MLSNAVREARCPPARRWHPDRRCCRSSLQVKTTLSAMRTRYSAKSSMQRVFRDWDLDKVRGRCDGAAQTPPRACALPGG